MIITEDIRTKINDCLIENKKPMSATEIADIIDMTTQKTTAILKQMVLYGEIKTCVINNNNKKYKTYVYNEYVDNDVVIDYEIASKKEEIRFAIEEFFDKVAIFIEKSVDFFILYWYN